MRNDSRSGLYPVQEMFPARGLRTTPRSGKASVISGARNVPDILGYEEVSEITAMSTRK